MGRCCLKTAQECVTRRADYALLYLRIFHVYYTLFFNNINVFIFDQRTPPSLLLLLHYTRGDASDMTWQGHHTNPTDRRLKNEIGFLLREREKEKTKNEKRCTVRFMTLIFNYIHGNNNNNNNPLCTAAWRQSSKKLISSSVHSIYIFNMPLFYAIRSDTRDADWWDVRGRWQLKRQRRRQ